MHLLVMSPVCQEDAGKYDDHARDMYPGENFMQYNGSFNAAEYRDEVTEQGCAACTKFANRHIPDQKTDDGGDDAQV